MRYFNRTFIAFCLICLCFTVFSPCGTKVLSAKGIETDFSAGEDEVENEKGEGEECTTFIKLPILMYHTIFKRSNGRFVISPSVLEEDFKYIKDNGFTTVTINDLIAYQENGKLLPDKPIMITFDDGNLTNYLNAFPLLKKYGLKAVMSIVGVYADSNYDPKGNRIQSERSYLTYEQMQEMHNSRLVEIQNHSYNLHANWRRVGVKNKKGESYEDYEAFLTRDLTKCNERIFDKAGIKCTAIAFPFGAYSKYTIKVIKKLGFKAALTCNDGINHITKTSDLFTLKRFNRPAGISTEKFFNKVLNNSK